MTKIYAYGAKAPGPADAVWEQLRNAHKYRNRLVELECQRRSEADAVLTEIVPDLVTLREAMESAEARVDEIRSALSARNSETRRHNAPPPELKDARAALKAARAAYKAARDAAWSAPGVPKRLKDVDAADNARRKAARAECGCHWGTYLTVEDAAKKFRKGRPPRFRRWEGGGRVAIQAQGGLAVEDFMAGSSTKLQCDADPDSSWHRVKLRIGSSGPNGRDPIWSEGRVKLHRPLPDGGRIKWAWWQARRIGQAVKWSLQIVMDLPDTEPAVRPAPCVVVVPRWDLQADGSLLAATWSGEDGRDGELILPSSLIGRWRKSQDLQSIRDGRFNAIRERLATWMDGDTEKPEWLRERLARLRTWHSQGRLAAAVIGWRNQRFEGDAEMFAELEAWRQKDAHLWNWQAHNQVKAARGRDDVFRNLVAALRRRYGQVELPGDDYRRREKPPEAKAWDDKDERVRMRLAAPGRLTTLIKESIPVRERPGDAETSAAARNAEPAST